MKMKRIVRLPFINTVPSAGIPLHVKSLACTVAGSTASLTLISKTVGWLNITLGQEVVTEQPVGVGVGVGVGLGGTVAVGVTVAVAVAVAVGVNVAVAVAVAVGVNVAVAVAVGVDVDVAVEVAVAVGVGVPAGSLKA